MTSVQVKLSNGAESPVFEREGLNHRNVATIRLEPDAAKVTAVSAAIHSNHTDWIR